MVTRLKEYWLKILFWDVSLLLSLVWETFSVRVWDLCHPSILRNLCCYWFAAVIPIQKANNNWRDATSWPQVIFNWLDDLLSLCGQLGREASRWLADPGPQRTVAPGKRRGIKVIHAFGLYPCSGVKIQRLHDHDFELQSSCWFSQLCVRANSSSTHHYSHFQGVIHYVISHANNDY